MNQKENGEGFFLLLLASYDSSFTYTNFVAYRKSIIMLQCKNKVKEFLNNFVSPPDLSALTKMSPGKTKHTALKKIHANLIAGLKEGISHKLYGEY